MTVWYMISTLHDESACTIHITYIGIKICKSANQLIPCTETTE